MKNALGTAAVLLFISTAALAAVDVGTLSQPGDTITTPLAFNKEVFNSVLDTQGLTFTIAPGQSGPVKLEVLTGTQNVKVAAAAIENAFGISQTLPLAIISDVLSAGVHSFAVGVVTAGAKEGAIISRLTLTPVPTGLLLMGTALVGLVGLRRVV